ncbi:UDP-glucose dehydrogenase family protein [Sedimentibacter sp. MB31-C6]|uniref:UDP-glucose dehydrogenase family protein n=1 Tax=Sedimentibacter sp. MB31-C6 TaxID=3109366 RepID=UPI002DDD2127|nr:UDP-glucose/GDP-mannose dehydrogenase family protein [Sedimentibacter sp. MB36-C1]WSI03561.1 UDP-glucose/GDP-mannose dehydrogenase family protein [Sedimentibacter sp. MB36-C1]
MEIGVIGTGYVGLVQGVILSEFGMNVTCMDVSEDKINKLNCGEIPIYEPGLKEMLSKNFQAKRINFTTNIKSVVEKSEIIFIAVGTPSNEDGSTDLNYVRDVARDISKYINGYKVIVIKSTVPVGTSNLIKELISDELKKRDFNIDFDIVSNPEFLREGKALKDCMNPDRIIIGSESEKAKTIMKNVYDVFNINQTPFVFTNLETAEMIKYASNSFLAVKISFINELALLSEKVGADIQVIARAMGMDGRISSKFLHAGPGYGGSCFPKDTKAIVDVGNKNKEEMFVINAAIKANEKQKQKMVQKIALNINENGNLKNKIIGILGLSFKPETDDMRDAPSIDIIEGLVRAGAKIQAFCPEGMKEAKWRLEHVNKSVKYMNDEYEVAKDADAIVIITEWAQFRAMDLKKIRENMKDSYFFDLRNVYSKKREIMMTDFKYFGTGI